MADRDDKMAGRTDEPLREALVAAAPAVRAYLLGLCGRWHEAEDLAQEALLAAWEARARFDGRSSVRTWLFTIARNRWIDLGRRRRVRPSAEPMDQTVTMSVDAASPPMAAGRSEFAAALASALARLPEEQRDALLLRETSGLTFPELAGVLAVPEATAKSRVRYALLKLAEDLKAFRAELES